MLKLKCSFQGTRHAGEALQEEAFLQSIKPAGVGATQTGTVLYTVTLDARAN